MLSPDTSTFRAGRRTGELLCATASTSLITATAVGYPPAPCPLKTTSPPNLPLVTTIFCVPCDHAIGELFGTSIGPTRADTLSPSSCARDTCRTVQPSSLAYAKSTAETCE